MSDSDDQGELRRTNSYEEGENNVKDRRSNVQFDPSIHTKKPWTRSKKYGYLFDLLLENGKHTDWVICKKCCKTLTKEGVTSLKYHADNHNDARPVSDASVAEALQKFAMCSCQPFSLVSDKSFLSFLDEFQKLTIQNYVIGHTIPARNLLPSPNTMSRRITSSMDTAKIQLLEQIAMLKQNGGGITLDFAKKGVDYLAVTAHYIDHNWALNDFVILFTPLPAGFHKTSTNVRNLVEEELLALRISQEDWRKLYVTTDEGTNISSIGGTNHHACLCHVGATIAKRTTNPYKNSNLCDAVKELCAEMESGLKRLEKLVNRIRQNELVRKDASQALKSPVQTRWLSYYKMVEALIDNRDKLQTAIQEHANEDLDAQTLLDLSGRQMFENYLEILRPMACMVMEAQAEKEPTSNRIIENLATIWLHLKEKNKPVEGNFGFAYYAPNTALNPFKNALAPI